MNFRMGKATILLPFLAVVSLAEDVQKDFSQRLPQVELKAQVTTVPLDGDVEVEVRLLNPSSDPLILYSNMDHGVVFRASNSEGKILYQKGSTHYHELCPPPPPRPYDFVRLAQGQFLGRSYLVAPAYLGIESPGNYSIVASYWLHVWGDDSDPHLSLMEQPVTSSPIRIKIVAKKR